MTLDLYKDDEYLRKERIVGTAFFGFVSLATLLDVIEDIQEGSTFTHVLAESFVIILSLLAGIYLWKRLSKSLRGRNIVLAGDLRQARADATKWKTEVEALSKGITEAIERQLALWGLSEAEQEVAFLLIKGLSTKEISQARSTSERTVRQQAMMIYRKSKLEGRSQLAAFFLEDLLAK